MNNTSRAQIFARHIGQNVQRPDGRTILQYIGVQGNLLIHEENHGLTYSGMTGSKLLLKPLYAITDEQNKILAEFWVYSGNEKIDYLRSTGVATDQTVIENDQPITYSVEKLVELGIYKLIEG